MKIGSNDKLQDEINELLNRSEELFHRSRNIHDQSAVREGELEAVINDSQRLLDELKHQQEEQKREKEETSGRSKRSGH